MNGAFEHNQHMLFGFEKVLGCLPDGSEYNSKPPKKTENLPLLSNEEVDSLLLNEVGESSNSFFNYRKEDLDLKVEEGLHPRKVELPTSDNLDGLEIFGVDGSNQRIDNPCFSFILARAAIVNFRYTKGIEKPYFYTKFRDCSAIVQIDGNVFSNSIKGHTYENLYLTTKNAKKEDSVDIYSHIGRNSQEKPLLLGYNHETQEKNPASHTLGWAVKLMNVLELMCFEDIPVDRKLVCIKDGPLFSTSSTQNDNLDGLNHTYKWENGVLIGVSKRVADSRLFLDIFCQFPDVIDYYFPNQNITVDTIRSIGTDALLLARIISPGERTPLIQAIPVARRNYVSKEHSGNPDLFPLVTYYMRRSKPHNVIRLEIPIFMYKRDPQAVKDAISVVAWQFEIGAKAPLVQLAADERCQISHEIKLLKRQTSSMIDQKGLNIPTYY